MIHLRENSGAVPAAVSPFSDFEIPLPLFAKERMGRLQNQDEPEDLPKINCNIKTSGKKFFNAVMNQLSSFVSF